MVLDRYFLFGMGLVILWILVLIRNYRAKDDIKFFWFCELSPILLAFGFFFGNIQLIKGIIDVGLITQFITLVSLVLVTFFGADIPPVTGNVKKGKFYLIVSYLLHLVPVNLALIFTLQTRATPISLIYGVLVLVLIFVLSLAFTPASKNINFVQHLNTVGFKPRYYKVYWFILAFLLIVLPTHFLQNWFSSIF